MPKTILLTGATDGIGLETAKLLVQQGHRVLSHGRNREKLAATEKLLSALPGGGSVETYVADLSVGTDVDAMADAVSARHETLDVLINNAGVFKAPNAITADGLDVRFAVNTLAPVRLTERLLPLMDKQARVVNVSSAAQAPVDTDALAGTVRLDDFDAYAQSKLALTMWSRHMAQDKSGPVFIAVNPGSLLGTKMVREGFGTKGHDIGIGADILVRAALEQEFAQASGQYFDNDAGAFAPPHADALDPQKSSAVVHAIEAVLTA